jgi:urea carboxylase
MTSPVIEVLQPGLQTQVQDEGRWGWQADGVPVGGAMDVWSHRIANLLVGNAADEATLEMLLRGPHLRFPAGATIALTGAELSPTVDGQPVAMGRALRLAPGAELAFGRRTAGLRGYLAVAGGIAVPPVLGSRSTYARGALGGHEGRALRAGDRLPLGVRSAAGPRTVAEPATSPLGADARATTAPPALDLLSPLPDPDPQTEVRILVVTGEHWHDFPTAARAAFLATPWRIGPQSDRMGYRLQGPALAPPSCGELLSDGVAFGTVQVPPDGQPIVLMAERQSTGGYPKIAHVASVDLPLLAQCGPGQRLRFEAVTADRAQALLEDRARHHARLRQALLASADA